MWTVYIVECIDQTLYTGIARCVDTRVAQHNAGGGAKYTRSRRPVVLIYQEIAADRGAALRREYAIKRLSRAAKQKLIAEAQPRSPGPLDDV
jgi:predicted GIY-YIG superfamily endonuclease